MLPHFQSKLCDEQFLVSYVIVLLHWGKFSGVESARIEMRRLSVVSDSTAPTPVVVASTSTMNGVHGSGYRRMGAVLNASLSFSKDAWASGVQDRDLGFLRSREVSGAMRRLKLLINGRYKLENPRTDWGCSHSWIVWTFPWSI